MSESIFQVVRRIGLRESRTWLALVNPNTDFKTVLAELKSELSAQLDLTPRIVRVEDLAVDAVTAELRKDDEDCVVLVGLDAWGQDRWRHLDIDRNAWGRTGPILLCLGPAAANALGIFSPNVKSYVGSFHVIGPDQSGMNEEEVEWRLSELRAFYGLTDQEVIDKAVGGELQPDAHFIEWLILLDRGDLV